MAALVALPLLRWLQHQRLSFLPHNSSTHPGLSSFVGAESDGLPRPSNPHRPQAVVAACLRSCRAGYGVSCSLFSMDLSPRRFPTTPFPWGFPIPAMNQHSTAGGYSTWSNDEALPRSRDPTPGRPASFGRSFVRWFVPFRQQRVPLAEASSARNTLLPRSSLCSGSFSLPFLNVGPSILGAIATAATTRGLMCLFGGERWV